MVTARPGSEEQPEFGPWPGLGWLKSCSKHRLHLRGIECWRGQCDGTRTRSHRNAGTRRTWRKDTVTSKTQNRRKRIGRSCTEVRFYANKPADMEERLISACLAITPGPSHLESNALSSSRRSGAERLSRQGPWCSGTVPNLARLSASGLGNTAWLAQAGGREPGSDHVPISSGVNFDLRNAAWLSRSAGKDTWAGGRNAAWNLRLTATTAERRRTVAWQWSTRLSTAFK